MLNHLNALIEFEQENTSLDFKLEEYIKPKTIDLIKDVMSMANAHVSGDRYIIIGMKPDADDRKIVGISKLSDAASLQQTIIDNVEPEIHLDYLPYNHNGKLLGVIKVYNCDSRPYLMKKDHNSGQNNGLKRGDGYIRMGTTQMRLFRSHFEQIYGKRFENQQFSGELKVSFSKEIDSSSLKVEACDYDDEKLPSTIARKKIEKIILLKEKELDEAKRLGLATDDNYLNMGSMMRIASANLMGGGTSYEDRSLNTLRKNHKNVLNTYYANDYFCLLEENSEKIDLYIKNVGKSYLKDVKVILKIPKTDGIIVADELPRDPDVNFPIINSGYPLVEEFDDCYEISEDLGDIKQHLLTKVFAERVRIFFGPKSAGKIINIPISFYATNLSAPIETKLEIEVSI